MTEPRITDAPDLDLLTGIRSGKPSFYVEYLASAERLRRVIHALDRISRALVRTTEGPGTLVRSVAEAASEHLTAHWVVFALADGALPEASPRHLVLGPDLAEVPLDGPEELPPFVLRHLQAVRHGEHDEDPDAGPEPGPGAGSHPHDPHHLHVPVRLDGAVVGEIVAWTGVERRIDATDASVLRVLASQTAAALQNSSLHQRTLRLYDEASRHAEDLAARNEQLQRTRDALTVARQREVLDSERHRIARELHDSVTQYALSAGMQIEVVRSEIRDEGQRERLETAKQLTRRAVEQLRSAIYALNHSGEHGHRTLPAMLEELSTVHMPSDLRVEVRIEGRPVSLPSAAERSLFRVAGEALFNAAVHAEASVAVVRLSFRKDRLVLSVADDGTGDPERVRRSLRVSAANDIDGSHRGLANMAERAREFGGTLQVQRARQGGIRVQVGIPLPIGSAPQRREPSGTTGTPTPSAGEDAGEPNDPGSTT
ncbi:MadS family sensor histidine kinase [Actinomycetospora termitidis]|uniref:GAF domain-containing sensor histidine kinase n=1 Tax=Actinomycetospora termitidis TaxID=3053470 RepID=A0ABT7MA55_9PSEU|nr:GAF domain-containing sensor histidine kinase [Actinomycetospora sp. Odt1-22]MDL5157537.1 GAF domain-containing sensor histidine kinase [Actinomycetospora sp. Odt1-22]